MAYSTVLFDLDGTLLYTLGDLASAVNYALSACGYPERSTEEVRVFVGHGVKNLMDRAVPEGTDAEAAAHCLEVFRSYYKEHLQDTTYPYPGIMELLQELQGRGIKTAVVSNKFDGAVKELCKEYFGELITVAMGESPENGKKPDPKMVRAALKALGSDGADAVYVGDSEPDVTTAKNAALPLIAVDWGFRSRETLLAAGAERVVSTAAELLSEILK